MKQIKRLIVLLALAFTLALVPAGTAQAKKPLRGTMEAEFNTAWKEPSLVIPIWVGSIYIEGTEYDIIFYNIGLYVKGNANHFEEIWEIWDGEVLILGGYDKGVTTPANGKFRMNGIVEEASGDWETYIGRNVHMSGTIFLWMEPWECEGTLRIN